jgi:hypothetical protein
MKKVTTRMFSMLLLVIVAVLALSSVNAAFTINEVELDEDALSSTGTNSVRDVEKGDEFEVKVHLVWNPDSGDTRTENKDVQVEGVIRGYDHDDRVEDISDVFDMQAGVTYVKKLNLKFPIRIEEDDYRLRVRVDDRAGETTQIDYLLNINPTRHSVEIFDVTVSPENGVQAGRALLTTVRMKNRGEKSEEDIKIKVSIPALGISATDYLDELDEEGGDDDSATSEELYMRIPTCAEAGDYTLRVEVTYDEGDERVSASMPVTVVDGDLCPLKQNGGVQVPAQPGQTVITIGPETQDVPVGTSGVVYPVTLTNQGSTAKTYVIDVHAADWADVKVSPSNVVFINPGESKAAYVYVSAKENAASGLQMFSVAVKSGDTTLKEVPLTANVVGGSSSSNDGSSMGTSSSGSLKRGLEIGLVVLVVLLVILGLIIGFNKLKDSDDEEPKEPEQTYY